MMSNDAGCEGYEPDPELITAEDIASARHCEIRIDGLPGQLRQGTYAVYFTGMEHGPGIDRPILRFRFAGAYPQIQYPVPPAGVQAQITDEITERHRPHFLTSAEVQAENAAQAEAGGWLTPQPQRQGLWSQPPDLYLGTPHGTTEVINVSKIARVITALLEADIIRPPQIGMSTDQSAGSWDDVAEQVEGWLRS